ncbi:unnamed protein product [Gordionus sp. m RMFG-2023]
MDLDVPAEFKYPTFTPIYLTGLDIIYNANHKSIWDYFCNNRKPNQLPIDFEIFPLDHNFPKPHTKRINYEWYIPKGLIKKNWINKHLHVIPSVIVFFYELDWNDVSWEEKKLECGTRLNILRDSLQNRVTKIIVVLIQNNSHFPPGEEILATERAADFCNTFNLPPKHLYILPFSDLFYGYTLKLEIAFYEIAQAYYNEKIKNVKSHISYLNKNLHQALIVRYNFKNAFFNEMKQDLPSALKCYLLAYDCLSEMRVPDSNLIEIKVVSGLIIYKICKLNFEKNSPLDAIAIFRKHLDIYRTKVGSYELSFEHCAWLEYQYKNFGDLFEKATQGSLIAIQAQHPGYYYVKAAQEAISRKKIITLIFSQSNNMDTSFHVPPYPSPDPLAGIESLEYYGQRPWKQGNLNTEHLDVNKEKFGILALQIREFNTDHSQKIISLLNISVNQFHHHRSPRLKNYLLLRIAEEHFKSCNISKCIEIITAITSHFRANKWWLLFTSCLDLSLKCAYLTANVQLYIETCLELLGKKAMISLNDKNEIYLNLIKILNKQIPSPEKIASTDKNINLSHRNAHNLWLEKGYDKNINTNVNTDMYSCVTTQPIFISMDQLSTTSLLQPILYLTSEQVKIRIWISLTIPDFVEVTSNMAEPTPPSLFDYLTNLSIVFSISSLDKPLSSNVNQEYLNELENLQNSGQENTLNVANDYLWDLGSDSLQLLATSPTSDSNYTAIKITDNNHTASHFIEDQSVSLNSLTIQEVEKNFKKHSDPNGKVKTFYKERFIPYTHLPVYVKIKGLSLGLGSKSPVKLEWNIDKGAFLSIQYLNSSSLPQNDLNSTSLVIASLDNRKLPTIQVETVPKSENILKQNYVFYDEITEWETRLTYISSADVQESYEFYDFKIDFYTNMSSSPHSETLISHSMESFQNFDASILKNHIDLNDNQVLDDANCDNITLQNNIFTLCTRNQPFLMGDIAQPNNIKNFIISTRVGCKIKLKNTEQVIEENHEKIFWGKTCEFKVLAPFNLNCQVYPPIIYVNDKVGANMISVVTCLELGTKGTPHCDDDTTLFEIEDYELKLPELKENAIDYNISLVSDVLKGSETCRRYERGKLSVRLHSSLPVKLRGSESLALAFSFEINKNTQYLPPNHFIIGTLCVIWRKISILHHGNLKNPTFKSYFDFDKKVEIENSICPLDLNLDISPTRPVSELVNIDNLIPQNLQSYNLHWFKVHDVLRVIYTLTNNSTTMIYQGKVAMGESQSFIFSGGSSSFHYNMMPLNVGLQTLPKLGIQIENFNELNDTTILFKNIPSSIYVYPANKL